MTFFQIHYFIWQECKNQSPFWCYGCVAHGWQIGPHRLDSFWYLLVQNFLDQHQNIKCQFLTYVEPIESAWHISWIGVSYLQLRIVLIPLLWSSHSAIHFPALIKVHPWALDRILPSISELESGDCIVEQQCLCAVKQNATPFQHFRPKVRPRSSSHTCIRKAALKIQVLSLALYLNISIHKYWSRFFFFY
jgi:hypothetical protein